MPRNLFLALVDDSALILDAAQRGLKHAGPGVLGHSRMSREQVRRGPQK